MNMNDKPFADWSWKNKQQSAPMQNTLAPLGSGAMEQAAPNMNAAPQGPGMVEQTLTGAGIDAATNVVEGAYKGYQGAAPLSANMAPVSDALVQPVVNGVAQAAPAVTSAIPTATTAIEGATALAPLAEGAAATGAAGGLAGAGAGASAALAAMGPVGWAGLGLMGAKAMGLFNDGTTKVEPKGYMNGTPTVGGK
jgi:hypothetical protein